MDWSVRQGCKRIVVDSNDADTFALLLFYMPGWLDMGLVELWQWYGGGSTMRYRPLHDIARKIGAPMAKCIVKLHNLTGNDAISKIGTKKAALKFDPLEYLAGFAEGESDSAESLKLAEKYLNRVYNGERCVTLDDSFDGLRLRSYRTKCNLGELPPTSAVMHGHIKRAAYLTREACNLLNRHHTTPSPVGSGWEQLFDVLVPAKC